MTALVTGGGGFLGLAIVKALLARGEHVRSFSRGRYPELVALGVDSHQGDIGDFRAVRAAAEGCDAVYHVAAKAGVWGAAHDYERANVLGTKNVVQACLEANVPSLVFTSSPSVVFHGQDESGIDESYPYPPVYLTDYPRTKALAEQHVIEVGQNDDRALSTISLRPHLIWGPGDPHLVPRIIARARAGRLRLVGNGENRVDSTYVDNAAAAHLLAHDAVVANPALSGRVYFISNDEPLPIGTLINRILAAADEPPVTRQIGPGIAYLAGHLLEAAYRCLRRTDEPIMTRFVAKQLSTEHWYDLGAAKRDLGYQPVISVTEGLARLAASLRDDPSLAPRDL